jgi:hypothetical protein
MRFFCELIKRLSQNFYSHHIWNKVIGENYYLPTILEFFKSAGFHGMYLEEQNLNQNIQNKYFSAVYIDHNYQTIGGRLIRPKKV